LVILFPNNEINAIQISEYAYIISFLIILSHSFPRDCVEPKYEKEAKYNLFGFSIAIFLLIILIISSILFIKI